MKLAEIVILLRTGETDFNNYIGGAVDLEEAYKGTLLRDMAFVLPLGERTGGPLVDSGYYQRMTERFGVVVALKNDNSDKDKTGILAFNKLHNIRAQFLKILVNVDLGYESVIRYAGGKLVDISNGYLWWQFDFEYDTSLKSDIDGFVDIEELEIEQRQQQSQLPDFKTIYINLVEANSNEGDILPYSGDLPLDDGFPDVSFPAMATWIDLSEDE